MKNDQRVLESKCVLSESRSSDQSLISTAERMLRPVGVLTALALSVLVGQAYAGAVTDTSWGRTPQTLSGNFVIPENMGKLAGQNLFHSFQSFNVNAGESATFTTNTNTIQNLISRVSGTEASTINGLLQLQAAAGSAPNFFFINPNGVTFGAGAQIDVPASFHVSTANNLRFADGTTFSAGIGPDSTFTVAAPEAFGFLGNAVPGKIALHNVQLGSAGGTSGFLGGGLDVLAGDIELTTANVVSGGPLASVQSAPVRFVAVGSVPKTVRLDHPPTEVDGQIAIAGSSIQTIAPIGSKGFPVDLYGGALSLADTVIQTTGSVGTSGDGGPISLTGLGNVTLIGTTLQPYSSAFPNRRSSGSINLNAGHLTLDGNTTVSAQCFNLSKCGDIAVRTNEFDLRGGARLITSASGSNTAGSITISATNYVNISGGSVESEGRLGEAQIVGVPVQSGHISVNADKVTVADGGKISIRQAAGVDQDFLSSLEPGTLSITARELLLNTNGQITAETGGNVPAGNIVLKSSTNGSPPGPLRIAGDGTGKITTSTDPIAAPGIGNFFDTEVSGVGDAGKILISAGRLDVSGVAVSVKPK